MRRLRNLVQVIGFCLLMSPVLVCQSANAQAPPPDTVLNLGQDFLFNAIIPYSAYDTNVDGQVNSTDIVDAFSNQSGLPIDTHPGSTRNAADVSSVLQDVEDLVSASIFPVDIPGAAPFFFGGGPPIDDAAIVDGFVLRNTQLFTNPANNLDVNNNGSVSSLDLLILINYIGANGVGTTPPIDRIAVNTNQNAFMTGIFGTSTFPADLLFTSRSFLRNISPAFRTQSSGSFVAAPHFLDVNGDGVVTSLDQLVLINNM